MKGARVSAGLAVGSVLLAATACGGSGKPTLKISAAASLKQAFTTYGRQFSDAKTSFSFAGSDALAAQIQQGVKPDIFASANTKLPDSLYAKGLVEKPVVFIANQLVLAVPANSTTVTSFADIEKSRLKLSIGTPTVPVGAYTATVLGKLPATEKAAIDANVKDREPDVTGIVGKLTQGAVDAGFLYSTDVAATKGKLKALPIPAALKPTVSYGIAIVKGAAHPKQAQAFIDGAVNGEGQKDLLASGFLAPPPAG